MDPRQKYRETHREEIREKAKRYHEENRDHIVERKRVNYDPEKSKRYYELNKQIRRIATKIKLNKAIPNVYKEDYTYLDQDKPVHNKRIIKHHKRHDSLESVYEVVQRLANHEQLEKETDEQLFCLNTPTPPIPIPKRNRRR